MREKEAGRRESYLDDLPWEMHGHRKKTLYFIERLRALAGERGQDPGRLRVLDLGCGNGTIVSLPVAEQGFEVTGVDLHEPSIAWARAHNRLPNARFVLDDSTALPFGEPFDAVILSDVLEHLEHPDQMLNRGLAHLAPDGLVLVSIPNGHGPFEIEQRLLRATGLQRLLLRLRRFLRRSVAAERPAYNEDCGHVQFFSVGSFERLLSSSGLRIAGRVNGCLFGGDLTFVLFRMVPVLAPISLWIADRLPAPWVSSWYFECRRSGSAA